MQELLDHSLVQTLLGFIRGFDMFDHPLSPNFEDGLVTVNAFGSVGARSYRSTLGSAVQLIKNK